jgi:1,4-dihydroxy-2-naphthoate octaprenyltransferase
MVWVCAAAVGVTTTSILFCSHFHQIEGDAAAGKRSPLVRLGAARATQVRRLALATSASCGSVNDSAAVGNGSPVWHFGASTVGLL